MGCWDRPHWRWVATQPSLSKSRFIPSDDHAAPSMELNVAGDYVFELQAWEEAEALSVIVWTKRISVISGPGIHVELLWVTPNDEDETDEGSEVGSDLDLHFVHHTYAVGGGHDGDGDGIDDPWFHQPFDAFWFTPKPNWGRIKATSAGLAIHSDVLAVALQPSRQEGSPGPKDGTKSGWIERREDRKEHVLGRYAVRQFEEARQPHLVRLAPRFHAIAVVTATDHRHQGDQHHRFQWIAATLSSPWVWKRPKHLLEERKRFCFVHQFDSLLFGHSFHGSSPPRRAQCPAGSFDHA